MITVAMPDDEEELLEEILDEVADEMDNKYRTGHKEHYKDEGSLGDKPALWASREAKKEHIDGYVYGHVVERQINNALDALENDELTLKERIALAVKFLRGN